MAKTLRIWLVDDDCDEHLLVTHVMTNLLVGVELRVIHCATLAVNAIESSEVAQLPQLILCDVKMPGMDGFEFLDWVRHSKWKALPVIMCSNSATQRDITRAYSLGANAYHVKAS